MSTFAIHSTVIEQIDKYRKLCLWRGTDINANQRPKEAWTMVCKSKEEGGLGVLNLKTQNEALLIKHLNKFFNREDIPWVSLIWESYYDSGCLPGQSKKGSFWWRDILKLLDKFKGIAKVNVNNAQSCYLWLDLWNNRVPQQAFPELFSFVKTKNTILIRAKQMDSLLELFHLPLSQQAFFQFEQLQLDLQQLEITDMPDSWTCIWSSGKFSVSKAYKHLSGHSTVHPGFKWIWNSNCQNKHKVFAWLIMKDRLSTRELLRRKNMELQNYNCILCNNRVEESLAHLLIHCPFAESCRAWINCHILHQVGLYQNLQNFRAQLQTPFFMEVIILMGWSIWKARNGLIFNQAPLSIDEVKRTFKSEFALVLYRAKRSYFPFIEQWLNNLV